MLEPKAGESRPWLLCSLSKAKNSESVTNGITNHGQMAGRRSGGMPVLAALDPCAAMAGSLRLATVSGNGSQQLFDSGAGPGSAELQERKCHG